MEELIIGNNFSFTGIWAYGSKRRFRASCIFSRNSPWKFSAPFSFPKQSEDQHTCQHLIKLCGFRAAFWMVHHGVTPSTWPASDDVV